MHADLFSHHASTLKKYVFVAVDERGEDVTSDDMCRRCNDKQQIRRRGQKSERRIKARKRKKKQNNKYSEYKLNNGYAPKYHEGLAMDMIINILGTFPDKLKP